jgi:hypothetical protein
MNIGCKVSQLHNNDAANIAADDPDFVAAYKWKAAEPEYGNGKKFKQSLVHAPNRVFAGILSLHGQN